MIATEQTVVICAPTPAVWDHVRNIERWAALMPGMREFEALGPDDSRWTLKVGVGGLVRTVSVLVHVEAWIAPGRVDFTYRLAGDPVEGNGTYLASATSCGDTEVTLAVRVIGSGKMAPMWEAMGRPLLPRLAAGFAERLKGDIEAGLAGSAPQL